MPDVIEPRQTVAWSHRDPAVLSLVARSRNNYPARSVIRKTSDSWGQGEGGFALGLVSNRRAVRSLNGARRGTMVTGESCEMQLCGFGNRRVLERPTLDCTRARRGRRVQAGKSWPGTRFLSPSLECTSGRLAACKYWLRAAVPTHHPTSQTSRLFPYIPFCLFSFFFLPVFFFFAGPLETTRPV